MDVRCDSCGWRGTFKDLGVAYKPNRLEPGDVIPEAVCPECESEDWDILEKEERVFLEELRTEKVAEEVS